MVNQSIRVFLAKNLNQRYVALNDCIVTQANDYMAFKRATVQIGNSVYQGFELKARSLRDANGTLFYYCPCRCGFVYDANLVPYRPVAVEYVPHPGLVELQDFELKQYFLDIQRQQRGHQPHLLQQLIENPLQHMLQYQNYMNQHYNRFLRLTAPQDSGQTSHYVIIAQVENPQVVEPLQNLEAHNEQQIAAAEAEVNVERAGDEEEEQAHMVVDDEQEAGVEVEEQEHIVVDNDGGEEKEGEQREGVADAEEDEEEEEEFEYEENEEDGEEEREVEEEQEKQRAVANEENEELEEFEYEENEEDDDDEEERGEEQEQGNMLPPPLEEQQRLVANEEDEELEAEPEGEEAQQHNAGVNEEEDHEGMEISDAEEEEELEDHEQMEISDDDEEEYGHLLPRPLEEHQPFLAEEGEQAKPTQCFAISSTSSDDSEEDAIYMDDGFLPAVNEWGIQSQKISSTVNDENDWSTDSADEDYH